MRQIALFLAVFAIALAGCDSLPAEQQASPANSDVVQSAQDWFEAQGAKIKFSIPNDGSPLLKSGSGKTRLQPDWAQSVEIPLSAHASLLVSPVEGFSSSRIQRRFVADVKNGKVVGGYYLDFYGPSARTGDVNSLIVD